MTVLHLDWESRSTVKLPDTGPYVYAMDPTTDLWLGAYAFDDEDPQLWHPGEPVPERVVAHIRSGGEIRAHNAAFERLMMKYIAVPRYGWPEPALEQYVCSAAEAAAMSLPRGLGELCRVTGIAVQKDDEGYQLMMRMCRPRKVLDDGTLVWWDVPERVARLGSYCQQDVRAEQAVEKALRRLTPREREIYLHTERKNDRGIYLDRALVIAAREVAQEGIRRANAELAAITGGAVAGVTKTGQLRQWLGEQGVANASVNKATVRELLDGELPPDVRRVIELRADAGRSSIAKLDAMLDCVCPDGYIRGLTMYHGASTGREAGKLVQPQNLPRGDVKDPERFIPDILAQSYDSIDLIENPVAVVSSLLRGCLAAPPGHDLIAADFSAIEARVLNVLAGQHDIVALFEAGEDVYSYNASRLPGAEPFVKGQKHPWRQTGKFSELGCGFGMGYKKAVNAAKATYGITLTEDEAKAIVTGYRETHPQVVGFWNQANDAAIEAVANPGSVVTFGALRNLKFTARGGYLYLILPSKRPLVYAAPKIVERKTPWGEMKPAVEFSSVDPLTKKWGRSSLYGGVLVENVVQAVSRDLLKEAELRVEEHGYAVVMSIHDETVVVAPEGFGSVAEFERLLSETPPWASGWPIRSEGWRGKRYRK